MRVHRPLPALLTLAPVACLVVGCVFSPYGFGATDSGVADALAPLDGGGVDAAPPCDVNPPWWDPGWRRRREIALGVVPANYTVALAVAEPLLTALREHLRQDLQDLRVVRWDGAWLDLDRRCQEDEGPLEISFRVQEDLDGTGDEPRYFLYLDNPLAGEPPGDLAAVYLYYDAFSRAELGIGSRYLQVDKDTGTPGSWRIDAGELVQDGTQSFTALSIPELAGRITDGFLLSYRWLGSAACPDAGPVFFWQSAASTGYYLERQAIQAALYTELDHTRIDEGSMSAPADDQWHQHVLGYYAGTLTFWEDWAGPVFSLTPSLAGDETVGIATYCDRAFRFDELLVRRYVQPEPVPVLQSEEICD